MRISFNIIGLWLAGILNFLIDLFALMIPRVCFCFRLAAFLVRFVIACVLDQVFRVDANFSIEFIEFGLHKRLKMFGNVRYRVNRHAFGLERL